MSLRPARTIAMNALLFALALAGCQAPAPEPPAPKIDTPVVVDQGGQKEGQHRHVSQRMYQLDDLKRAKIKIDGKHEFNVWVMDTEQKRQEGMMFLEESDFKADEGMIFVFKQPVPLKFWMMNTLVPLDIAYVTGKKTILSMYTMKARDTTTDYSSKGNAMYAIELKAGTFKEKGITRNMKVEIPDWVKEKEEE